MVRSGRARPGEVRIGVAVKARSGAFGVERGLVRSGAAGTDNF